MSEQLPEDVPDWEDEYLDRVSDRLMHNYDLEKDVSLKGEPFDMEGQMHIQSEKHFFHPSLNYANHESREFIYARRQDRLTLDELQRLIDIGHEVADERAERKDEHFSTDVTFAIVVDDIDPEVADFVEGYSDRNLLRFGFHGHYEINVLVVAPEQEELVRSVNADVATAFRLWEKIEAEEPSRLDLILRRLEI